MDLSVVPDKRLGSVMECGAITLMAGSGIVVDSYEEFVSELRR